MMQNGGTGVVVPPQQTFDSEQMIGSMQQILSDNIGEYAICEFLIGTQFMRVKAGILYSVGTGFIVLYEEIEEVYVVCDIFSIKFVTFYQPGRRPENPPSPYFLERADGAS